VPHIKAVIESCSDNKTWDGKITVIIASKRHHVRAFPIGKDGADHKGNPLPGVLIERDVTSYIDFDFFLFSHTAIQGTSRPVHYTIIYDDAQHRPELIQNMLYEHCYQYMRSTTSVSLHPAVYYAHLASNRAKAHEDITATEGPPGFAGFTLKSEGIIRVRPGWALILYLHCHGKINTRWI
jgi:eukaryotic translation initiation factor 2C